MNIFEELTDKENKKKWRELVRKYHPDNKETGNEKIMKKVNNAYEKGDRVFERLVAELKGEKPPTDDYDKMDEPDFDFDRRDPDRPVRSPINSLLIKIFKENSFVIDLSTFKIKKSHSIIESYGLTLQNDYMIKVKVSTVKGRRGLVKVDIKLMDGSKEVKDDKGPVPIANDEMIEKRIKELIEKAKKLKPKSVIK